MTFKDKIEQDLVGSNVSVDVVGGGSAKGKIVEVEEDFIIMKTTGGTEIYVALDKIAKIWETL